MLTPTAILSGSPEERNVKVTRNFECEMAEPIAVPSGGTVSSAGPLVSEESVTGVILPDTAGCKDGHCFRKRVSQQSPELAGEK